MSLRLGSALLAALAIGCASEAIEPLSVSVSAAPGCTVTGPRLFFARTDFVYGESLPARIMTRGGESTRTYLRPAITTRANGPTAARSGLVLSARIGTVVCVLALMLGLGVARRWRTRALTAGIALVIGVSAAAVVLHEGTPFVVDNATDANVSVEIGGQGVQLSPRSFTTLSRTDAAGARLVVHTPTGVVEDVVLDPGSDGLAQYWRLLVDSASTVRVYNVCGANSYSVETLRYR